MNKFKFKIGEKVCRKINPFNEETITQRVLDNRGERWYWTTTANGTKRTIALAEHEIISAGRKDKQ